MYFFCTLLPQFIPGVLNSFGFLIGEVEVSGADNFDQPPDDFLEPPDLGIIHATIERSVHFLEALPCEDELAVDPVAF